MVRGGTPLARCVVSLNYIPQKCNKANKNGHFSYLRPAKPSRAILTLESLLPAVCLHRYATALDIRGLARRTADGMGIQVEIGMVGRPRFKALVNPHKKVHILRIVALHG